MLVLDLVIVRVAQDQRTFAAPFLSLRMAVVVDYRLGHWHADGSHPWPTQTRPAQPTLKR
jgi:hypothetical protein